MLRPRVSAAPAHTRLALESAGEGTWIHVVEEGLVRPVAITPDGREFGLGLLGPGEAFLHQEGDGPHGLGFYVEAVRDSCCLGFPRAELGDLALRDPEAAGLLLAALTRRVADLSELAASLTLDAPAERVARLIRRLAQQHGVPEGGALRLRLRQQDLAAMAGLCRETVNGTLRALADQGLLRLGRQTIWLLDGAAGPARPAGQDRRPGPAVL